MTSAIEFFEARLRWQIDPADLAAERASGVVSHLLIDVRDDAAWQQGRIPGAIHIPGPQLAARMPLVAPDHRTPVIAYCWGPGCNGSTKAARDLLRLGYRDVRELIGGFEYWAREGLAIVSAAGRHRRPVDDLTAAPRAAQAG